MLLPHHRPDAAGSLAQLHHSFADRPSASSVRTNDVFGTFSVMGFSSRGGSSPNYGLIFAPLKPSTSRKRQRPLRGGDRRRPRAQALRCSRRPRPSRRASRHSGHRHRRRLPVQAAGPGAQHLRRHRPRRAHTRRPRAARLRPHRPEHQLHLQRSPALVAIDREKAKALGVSFTQITDALQVFMGSQYVNDFDFNNRSYRVYVQADQQFRADCQGHPPVLRPLRHRPDDPARQPGHHRANLRRPRSSATTTSSAPRRSTAPPRPAQLRRA